MEYGGGEIGNIGMKVSDQSAVPLRKGERVLLFLKSGKSKKDGQAYNIVGKGQGKYSIDAKGIARKSGVAIMGSKENIDNNLLLDELIEKTGDKGAVPEDPKVVGKYKKRMKEWAQDRIDAIYKDENQ